MGHTIPYHTMGCGSGSGVGCKRQKGRRQPPGSHLHHAIPPSKLWVTPTAAATSTKQSRGSLGQTGLNLGVERSEYTKEAAAAWTEDAQDQ